MDISRFPRLSGVCDAVYNPLRTPLILAAKERGIPAEGGLYMLVAQAVRASEIFIDTKYEKSELIRVFLKMMRDKENIVLTGMPASGKSTVGKLVSDVLGREFIDTDTLIVEKTGKDIPRIFSEDGERAFRDIESEVIRETAAVTGAVIATGGGAVLRSENVRALRENGKIYFIDRPLDSLIPTSDRPTASNKEDIIKRYNERYSVYKSTCDVRLDASGDAESVAKSLTEDFLSE